MTERGKAQIFWFTTHICKKDRDWAKTKAKSLDAGNSMLISHVGGLNPINWIATAASKNLHIWEAVVGSHRWLSNQGFQGWLESILTIRPKSDMLCNNSKMFIIEFLRIWWKIMESFTEKKSVKIVSGYNSPFSDTLRSRRPGLRKP